MQTDGQLYDMSAPPSSPPPQTKAEHREKGLSIKPDELLLVGLIYLISSDKKSKDLPLLLALVYILLF